MRSAAEELLSTCHSVNMFILNKYSEMRILTSTEVCCDICSHFVSVVDNANANTSEELHLELAKQCEVGMQLGIVLIEELGGAGVAQWQSVMMLSKTYAIF